MHSEIFGERDESSFFSKIKEISLKIKSLDDIVVIHHYDADGLSSGAIVINALKREGKQVKNLCLKQLYKENIEEIRSLGKTFLFVDFGSGQSEYLVKEFDLENLFILDHHQPSVVDEKIVEVKYHANPLLFGIDGGNEISGAGVAYFFAKTLDEKNKDLSSLAIVGAVGDMQESRGELVGLNRVILQDAINEKVISVKKDLRLYGRISRPLTQFLCFSSSPILPELTAQPDNCIIFLNRNKIPLKDDFTDQWLSYEDLVPTKKQELISALVMHLSLFAVPEWKIKEMIGEVYTLENEDKKSPLRDAKEFATALNSCGRHARPQVGLEVCLGDRNIDTSYGELLSLIAEHRIALAKGIQYVSEHGVEEKKSFYFFDAKDEIQDSLVGIIAGMLYGSVIDENKPIIALAKNTDGTIKVSGRGTSELLRRGLNLGGAFKEISKEIEGVEGGGHRVAAGCKVPCEKLDEFLKKLEIILMKQINIL